MGVTPRLVIPVGPWDAVHIMPKVVVIAGPNGAGKSTTAPAILRDALKVHEFVNADTIAAGLSAFSPESVALAAGRIMLDRVHELARDRRDFAFETTLASRTFASWLRDLQTNGYKFHLVYLCLPTVELAVARVAERVRRGGHGVSSMSEKIPSKAELEAEAAADEELQDRIVEAAGRAVEEAIRDHKRAGNPIAEWRDGRVVLVPPEDLEG
jgi:predicted ABC-type ATPase